MDFEFNDDQRLLHETVRNYVKKEYPFERFQGIRRSASGWSREVWRGLADLGVLAINVPEALGGLGQGPLETLSLMDACGPSLMLEPVVGSGVIATTLLRLAVDSEARSPAGQGSGTDTPSDLLRAMGRGKRIAVLAHQEAGAGFDTDRVAARACADGDGYRIDGHKAVVAHAAMADEMLVSARTSADGGARSGVSLFRVPRDAPGVTLDRYTLLDGCRAADVHFENVAVGSSRCVGEPGAALPMIEAALDAGLAAYCAEAVGIMSALLGATVDHLRTRRQFGQPIGRFQALQHRAADMAIHLEQARSMSYLAAMRCNCPDLGQRRLALSAAKVVVGEAARFVGQQAVQLHGGMGMTDELPVSHWFKRLTAIDLSLGDADVHLLRYLGLGGGLELGSG